MSVFAREQGHCAKLDSPSKLNLGVSIFLLAGIVVSYVIQHLRIIARRSSEGISPYFVLLGATSATFAFANILILPSSREDAKCCSELSPFSCFAALLGMIQVGTQWACFIVLAVLFLIFFPREDSSTAVPPHLRAPDGDGPKPRYRDAVGVITVTVLHAIVMAILNAVVFFVYPESSQNYAGFLGICSMMLASFQYIPQLYTTYKLKTVGSLSIPMMCLQTPGGYLWAASLAARTGWQGWSTWLVFLVTANLQSILLGMGIVYELRIRREKKLLEATNSATSDADGGTNGNDERAPLLGRD